MNNEIDKIKDRLVFACTVSVLGVCAFMWSSWMFVKMANEAQRLQEQVTALTIELIKQDRVTQNGVPVTTGNNAADRKLWSDIPKRGSVHVVTNKDGEVFKFQR